MPVVLDRFWALSVWEEFEVDIYTCVDEDILSTSSKLLESELQSNSIVKYPAQFLIRLGALEIRLPWLRGWKKNMFVDQICILF